MLRAPEMQGAVVEDDGSRTELISLFMLLLLKNICQLKDEDFQLSDLQESIYFNTVNIHRTVGMYFLVSTGNRDDIEWNDQQIS